MCVLNIGLEGRLKGLWFKQLSPLFSNPLSGPVPNSDEELEDSKALLYLPIAPEVEDPEENPYGPPPDAVPTSLMDEGASSEKKRQSSADGSQPPKKKPKTTNIELQGVPNDGKSRLFIPMPVYSNLYSRAQISHFLFEPFLL